MTAVAASSAAGPARSPARTLVLAALVLAPLGIIPAPAGAQEPAGTGTSAESVRAEGVSVERRAYVMGTVLRARVDAADRAAAIRASEAAFEAVRRTEALLSTWRAGTELASLNAAPPGRPVPVSEPLLDLLTEVAAWSDETEGAFDPAVGALVDAWDLRGAGRHPSTGELERALASTGLRCFDLDPAGGTARRVCPGAWLDAGAFGKGAALREARRALAAAGVRSARLDFGGQHLALGGPGAGRPATVGVAHPARRAEPAVRIELPAGSAATTGQSERGAETPGGRIGHVLDPRTGLPVPPWGSVTVVADDPLAADLLSTALYVMGPSAGLEWVEGRPEIAALFLVEEADGLSVRAGEAMRKLLIDRGPKTMTPKPMGRSQAR